MGEGIHNKKQTHYNPKNDTEGGLTRDQRARVLDWENRHADDDHESVAIIDKNGKITFEKEGEKSRVRGIMGDAKDKIIVHNHPGHDVRDYTSPDAIARNIGGYPLSRTDVESTISQNAQGIRARTGRYIFSLERNGKDWGEADAKELDSLMKQLRKEVPAAGGGMDKRQLFNRYVRNEIAVHHRALKAFAEKYGLKYTRRKVK